MRRRGNGFSLRLPTRIRQERSLMPGSLAIPVGLEFEENADDKENSGPWDVTNMRRELARACMAQRLIAKEQNICAKMFNVAEASAPMTRSRSSGPSSGAKRI